MNSRILSEKKNKKFSISIIFFSAVLYTLSKQAKVLSANKLYLQVNNRLQSLKVPPGIQEQVDVSVIYIGNMLVLLNPKKK